jgi:hypothetical protein
MLDFDEWRADAPTEADDLMHNNLYEYPFPKDKLRAIQREAFIAGQQNPAESALRQCVPDVDPVTGDPFFMFIENGDGKMVPTYGGPFNSYTLAERESVDDNGICRFLRECYDHDEGAWRDSLESLDMVLVNEDEFPD